ncbi:MAG TPA: 1-phosphofructokinase family hexose kinase [Methylomirabilota bacterium]|nr:1-phosphofructokinase family hexose kinase [Methylomirabilota bacterium]
MLKPIVTLTLNPAIDGASEAEVVQPTRKIRTTNQTYEPGGGGINVTRVVHELGGNSVAVYLAGGSTGGVLDDLLGARGIARRKIPITDNTRMSHVVFERSTGLEYRFIPEGPEVTEREWARCLTTLDQIEWDYLVASGSLPRGVPADFYATLQERVAARGSKLVLDTSGEPLRLAMEKGGLHLVKPSHGEFQKLLGLTLKTPTEIGEAALVEVRRGRSDLIAVTMGDHGAVLASESGYEYLPSPEVKVLSASGAGDSFVAGMVQGLALGRTVPDSFALGVAAGSAAVLTLGTRLCTRTDTERLLAEILQARVRRH